MLEPVRRTGTVVSVDCGVDGSACGGDGASTLKAAERSLE